MPSQEIVVVATLLPKQGKTNELLSTLQSVADYCQKNEPGTLQYTIHRSLKPGADGDEVVLVEKYKDGQALKAHGSSQTFGAFQKTLKEKDLLRAPFTLKVLSEHAGYGSRL